MDAFRTWAPVAIALAVAALGITVLISFHFYRVSGLDWRTVIADPGQLLTPENIKLGVLVLILGAGLSIFTRRR